MQQKRSGYQQHFDLKQKLPTILTKNTNNYNKKLYV
jgi:hypothetical protein